MTMVRWLLLFAMCWSAAGFAFLQPGRRASSGTASTAPRRIVSLAPNITEILCALGVQEQIVGVTHNCDYPPAVAAKKKIGTFWQPNIEAIIALRPGLVITLGFDKQSEIAARLGRIGYPCVSVAIDCTEDLFEAVEIIGSTVGADAAADRLAGTMREELRAVTARTAGRDKPKVLWVVQRDPLRVAGRDTFVNEIIEMAGGRNAIGRTLHKYPPLGSEQVIASEAEVIIEPTMRAHGDVDGQQRSAVRYWSRFPTLPAVTSQRICVIDGDLVSRLSPRLSRGVRSVARILQPDLFE